MVSSIAPGYIGGGSQCALALVQAISRLHHGNAVYLGPAFLQETDPSSIDLADYRVVGTRSTLQKLSGALTSSHVDRVTTPAKDYLASQSAVDTVVYVSGESAGRVVSMRNR